ncbi:MAG: ATPase [Devosia sp.]|nr:ATPase [Devosia sp.]
MTRLAPSPALIITVMAAIAVVAVGLCLWGTANTPWLGLELAPRGEVVVVERSGLDLQAGTPITAIAAPGQPAFALTPGDLTLEPDALPNYAAIDSFIARQDQLFELLRQPELTLYRADGTTIAVFPGTRPLWSMPGSFWVQVITGVTSVLIAFWVWALRPRQLAPGLFALSGVGVLLVTLSSAFYAHRGLALPGEAWRVLLPLNHLGIQCFSIGLIGLFLIYPRPLVDRRWLWLLPLVSGLVFLFDTLHIVLEAEHFYITVMLITLTILLLIAGQWWATRRHPDERAALGWLGLSVAIALACFSFVSLAPGVLGFDSLLSQHYGAGAIILIYLGLAMGLRRYRLFELGEWSYRILFYIIGAFALLGLDAALIAGLNIGLAPALAISLLLVALLYLPLRDWLWRRVFARQQLKEHELFSAAMDVAFAPSRHDSATRWRALLGQLFDPLESADHRNDLPGPAVSDDGLTLTLPSVAGAPGLRLSYPFGGRGLFRPGHLALAANLVALTEKAEESRQAYMRGVGEERRRMARDLHDDVGARLLTGLHTADERTRPTLQAALSDIRAIVSGLVGEEAELDRVLAQIRHEAARRLEAANIALDWPLPETGPVRIDYRAHKALTSATREVVSNVIRHSGATTLAVTLATGTERLSLRFSDDGRGLPEAALAGDGGGYGLRNLRQRLEDLGGTVAFEVRAGTAIAIDLPLQPQERPPEPGVQFSAPELDSPP